jgi:signal transduction histidine kinase
MKNYIKDIKNFFDLKKIYILIFITLTAWSIFAYVTITNLINSQKIYAEIINLSGKQRMLSQKTTLIGKRFLEEDNQELKNHLEELVTLMEKDHHYIINNLTSQDIYNIYFSQPYNLNFEVKNFISLLKNFIKTAKKDTLKEIEITSFELLPKLNYAVNIFEKESDTKTKELLRREQFILIGTILTLLLEAIFIVIPSIKFARKKEKEFEELNNQLKEKIALAVKENNEKEKIIQHQYFLNQTAELINNIAHQWRQPLSLISTIASGIKLKKQLDSQNEEKDVIEGLTLIINKTQYLSNTIDQLSDFVNIDEKVSNLNLEISIKSILKIFNTTNLTNIFSNILDNAQYVLNERKIKDKQIFINVVKENDYVFIIIEDNAGGVQKEIINKIFDMYFTTKHQRQGTGLGLYLTKIIIEKKFKGNINVENGELGSKFLIKLPIFQTINN